ncbi:MAG: nucleotide exchange factor GrpE [Rhodospirillaceae bacterium]|nr:nucleotide exchange factor GrpE [Rhodospirillaceae bacterium]MYB15108.1 nucleotide exchange factor GrpE [Rhodospirillaceae bacterium]MYI51059.1 nucleotide exchange factor GrpE [Rhodospirillaceae bacterium]
MTETPRKTDPGEETPAGDNDGGSAGPEDPPAAASEPAAPPEAANDSDAPEARAPQDGDPAGGGAEPAGPDSGEADSGEADSGETGAPALTEEQQRIVDLEIEVAELKDRALRAMADADNARKRAARDVADSRKYGATGLARDILTVADNLGRALEAVPDLPREEDENLFNLRAGVDMTLQEMLQALERHGVKKVTPETGERFDHNRHQAMFEVPTDELAPGAVAQVVQDGYVIHDRLLRPALVGVARKPPEEPAPEEAAEVPEDAAEPPEENTGESDAA